MPLFQLSSEIAFPSPALAEPDGLLAVGGDLCSERLLAAYRAGIFPWYSEGWPILWWSPDPRLVLYPDALHVSHSLRRTLRKGRFVVTMDRSFDAVIQACAAARGPRREATWIVPAMVRAYCRLHREGWAHSVETWQDGMLAGGLYGVALGGCFFGESMFSNVSDASKVALVALVRQLAAWEFVMIDCQIRTPHLVRLGARDVSRAQFLGQLAEALKHPTRRGPWELAISHLRE